MKHRTGEYVRFPHLVKFQVTTEDLETLRELAQKHKTTKSKLLRQLVRNAMLDPVTNPTNPKPPNHAVANH